MPPPVLSLGPAIWAGRGVGLSGVGSSGMSRRRARLPRGKGVRPGPFPRAPAGKGGPRGTGAATKEACPSPRPPPARGPPRRPGTRPAPGDPPCARAASRCHRRSLSRPSQTPSGRGVRRRVPRPAALSAFAAAPGAHRRLDRAAPRSRSLPHEMTNVGAPPARARPATSGVKRLPLGPGGLADGACAGARGPPGARRRHLAGPASCARFAGRPWG